MCTGCLLFWKFLVARSRWAFLGEFLGGKTVSLANRKRFVGERNWCRLYVLKVSVLALGAGLVGAIANFSGLGSPVDFGLGVVCAGQGPSLSAEEDLPFGPAALGIEMGGIGGAYFAAEPGTLTIEVTKRDLNRTARTTELRAILAGPDRQVLAEAFIPDDGLDLGKLGPRQSVRLSAEVPRPGIYALNITVSQDRYGEAMYWSFRTNCRRYVIETSRGHRDAPHEEPIVLYHPEGPARVCFLPSPIGFRVEVIPGDKTMPSPELLDGFGKVAGKFEQDERGSWRAEIPPGADPDSLWQLVVPPGTVTVHVDGLTRWRRGDPYPDLCYWTPKSEAYFPFVAYRWLLTPYRRVVYLEPREERELTFQVHNNGRRPIDVVLLLESSEEKLPVELSANRVRVAPGVAEKVTVRFTLPEDRKTCTFHLRATPAEDPRITSYSTVEIRRGRPPAAEPFTPPLVLKPYAHENEQFGLLPDYPTENEMYFDLTNRPVVLAWGDLYTLGKGGWDQLRVRERTVGAGGKGRVDAVVPLTPKIAFDSRGGIYFLAQVDGGASLMYSPDGGETFRAYPLPPTDLPASYDLEVFTGHNVSEGPPPILRFLRTGRDPKLFWRFLHRLELFVPERKGNEIVLGEPILLSDQCLGLSAHSGSPCCLVSSGQKVHMIWAEATDPAERIPGTPAYVSTFDRETRRLGKKVFVGYGAPPNDIHNTPAISMDSKGYLHTLGGTHGAPFPYARSLVPHDTQQGFSEPHYISREEQTYIGLVCGRDDTLFTIFRSWQRGKPPFLASHYATLALQRKTAEGAWEEPQVLIVPPFSEYSVFYHRLTVDRKGRLFLSYDYWSTHWFYRIDHFGRRRVTMFSSDGGQTWKFLTTEDLLSGN
jgi:hypothetical protein